MTAVSWFSWKSWLRVFFVRIWTKFHINAADSSVADTGLQTGRWQCHNIVRALCSGVIHHTVFGTINSSSVCGRNKFCLYVAIFPKSFYCIHSLQKLQILHPVFLYCMFCFHFSLNFAGKIWMKLQYNYSGSFSDAEGNSVIQKRISSWCSNSHRGEVWTVEYFEPNTCLMLQSIICIICVPCSVLYLTVWNSFLFTYIPKIFKNI